MAGARRRILVAVDPVVLEGALASILQRLDLDDVVTRNEGGDLHEHYDAAIVTISLPSDERPDVVITLPDTVGSGSSGHLVAGDRSEDVELTDAEGIIDLLDATVPAASSRSDRLRQLFDEPH